MSQPHEAEEPSGIVLDLPSPWEEAAQALVRAAEDAACHARAAARQTEARAREGAAGLLRAASGSLGALRRSLRRGPQAA